jgi:hypothetical protein
MKNTGMEYQTKLFPLAKAFFGFCLVGLLLVSCASGPKRSGNLWNANTDTGRLNYFGASAVDGQNILQYWFEDQKSKQFGYQLPHGHHNVEISTTWSNGFENSTQLPLDVKDGSKYAVYAYELQEGQDPTTPVDLTKAYQEQTYTGNAGGKALKTLGEAVLGSVGGTAMAGASLIFFVYGSPIWVPYVAYAYYQRNMKSKEAAKGPQDNTTNTEVQTADSVVDTAAQPPDSTLDTETKSEDTATVTVSQSVEPPPPTARPFDGCCYVWIEDSDTREVVAGTSLPGARK